MTKQNRNKFQPMPASFGLVPELSTKIKDKKLRYKAYQKRSLDVLKVFKKKLNSFFKKDHLLVEIN
jgi:folate-dependent tRNA-U54 methylase TrmFO/GidA